MAKKGPKILLAVFIVILIYLIAVIIMTRPGYEEHVKQLIARKNGDSYAVVSLNDDIRAVVREEIAVSKSEEANLPTAPVQVDTEAIVSDVLAEIDTDAIAKNVLEQIDTDAIVSEASEKAYQLSMNNPVEVTLEDVSPLVPDIFEAVSTEVYSKIPEIAEQLKPEVMKYVPEMTKEITPEVLSKVLDTFSDSSQLQKAMVDWMAENQDALVTSIISTILSSNELRTKVLNIVMSDMKNLAPAMLKEAALGDGALLSALFMSALDSDPEISQKLVSIVLDNKEELAAALVQYFNIPATEEPAKAEAAEVVTETEEKVEVIPEAIEAPAVSSEAVSEANKAPAEEPAPVQAETSAETVPAEAPVAVAVVSPVAETTVEPAMTAAPETTMSQQFSGEIKADSLFSENNQVQQLSDEEFAAKESVIKDQLVNDFKNKLKD